MYVRAFLSKLRSLISTLLVSILTTSILSNSRITLLVFNNTSKFCFQCRIGTNESRNFDNNPFSISIPHSSSTSNHTRNWFTRTISVQLVLYERRALPTYQLHTSWINTCNIILNVDERMEGNHPLLDHNYYLLFVNLIYQLKYLNKI